MGNISKEERARRAAALSDAANSNDPVSVEASPDLTGLIKVSKDGETLHVHPCALLQHKHLGWREA